MGELRPPLPPDVQALLRSRNAPAIYVVDAQNRVVLGWHSGDGAPGTAAQYLPLEIETAVAELQWALSKGAQPPLVRLLDSSYIVRVTPLAGDLGSYHAVLVERFRSRDHLTSGSRRYALTKREHEVLKQLVDGARTAEIADALDISQSTVALHIKSIMTKTSSRTRAEMLGRIIAHGFETNDRGAKPTPS